MRNDAALTKHYETAGYSEVTAGFFERPRESQKKIVEDLKHYAPKKEKLRFLDLGCGPGSLLPHIEAAFPTWELYGLDISDAFLKSARSNRALANATFHKGDLLDPALHEQNKPYDVIVAHAVLYNFSVPDIGVALANIARMLNRGGVFIAFEWLQKMGGELTISFHPDNEGLPLAYHVHRQSTFQEALKPFGVAIKACVPFDIPITIEDRGWTKTHTKMLEKGQRLQFWGDIYQPWHFLVAEKREAVDPAAGWKPEPDDDEWT